jgi:hypothetical protein
MYFKNRSIQMKFVKDADTVSDTIESHVVDPELIAKIATDYTIKTIGAVGVVVAGNRVLKTICEIAVVAAKAKIK